MNEQKYPQLEKLHILRTETLVSIRDRAFETLPLFLENYGDGIVSGCRPVTTRESITLSEGIILHNKFLYLIKEPVTVDYEPTDETMIMKMIFSPEIFTENFIQRNVSVELSHNLNLADNEMELCRFKLKKGAILRTEYTNFFDRVTEFDTINTINVPYAAPNGSTISPEITKNFAEEAKNFSLEPEDFSFCLEALSGKILSAEQIAFYIEHKLRINLPNKKNQTLYDNLCLILQDIQGGRTREIVGGRNRRREIIVE